MCWQGGLHSTEIPNSSCWHYKAQVFTSAWQTFNLKKLSQILNTEPSWLYFYNYPEE